MTKEQQEKQNEMIHEAKKNAKWFKVEVTISIFGQTIFNWVWPPQKEV